MRIWAILFCFILTTSFVWADEIVLKVGVNVNDSGTRIVEFKFFRGTEEIAKQIYDVQHNLLEAIGRIPDGTVKFNAPQTNILTVFTYKDNRRNGEAITYYPTGEKSGVQNYKDGQLLGLQQGLRKNGSIKDEYIINQEQPSIHREFFENGNLKSETIYKTGKSWFKSKIISKKVFNEDGRLITHKKY